MITYGTLGLIGLFLLTFIALTSGFMRLFASGMSTNYEETRRAERKAMTRLGVGIVLGIMALVLSFAS